MAGQSQASDLERIDILDGSIKKPMEINFEEESLGFPNVRVSKEPQTSRSNNQKGAPPGSSQKILVCVRKKPIDDTADVIGVQGKSLMVQSSKLSYCLQDVHVSHKFAFDFVFDKNIANAQIFDASIRELVDHSLRRGSSSIIAYGQTGTGKTHTVLEPHSGVIFEAIKHALKNGRQGNISFCEIYMGQVYDCLNSRVKISLFEQSGFIYASEVHQKPFRCFGDAEKIFEEGLLNRRTSATDSNNYSSRSHAVIFIEFTEPLGSPETVRSKQLASANSLVFVDLAGSERGSDRKTCTRTSAIEGAEINKSLLALKECVRGIELGNKFLSFRQSKLTQILKNSLTGRSMTCLIATISANQRDIDHTLNTLRYAHRIKEGSNVLRKQEEIFGECNGSGTVGLEEADILLDSFLIGNSKPDFSIKKPDLAFARACTAGLEAQKKVTKSMDETKQVDLMEPIPSPSSDHRCTDEACCATLDNGAYADLNSSHPGATSVHSPENKDNLVRLSEVSKTHRNSVFDCLISEQPFIRSSTVKLQKIRINETVNDIIASIRDDNNLQTLKEVFLGLKSISESLKRG